MSLNLTEGLEPVAGYTLVRLRGRGGFGEVWEARAPGGVRVALKFIRLDADQAGPEQRALEIIRDIRHPHLLDVQFAVRVEDCLVIAMPLCDESLMDRLRACQAKGLAGVPRDELLGYMDEVARAVDFLNEPRHPSGNGRLVGVQHRDIKPHNIFLVGGSARLADFGVAKILEATSASHTGSMSPNYVAPEVLEGRVSQHSDQYSLAVAYAHLRSGRLPFAGESVNQVLYAHAHGQPNLTGLPEAERPVLVRALAKRPEQRWPSCRAFVTGLEAVAIRADGALATTRQSTLVPDTLGRSAEAPEANGATKLPETEGPESRALPSTVAGASSATTTITAPAVLGRVRAIILVAIAMGLAILAALVLYARFAPTWPDHPNTAEADGAAGSKATEQPETPVPPVTAQNGVPVRSTVDASETKTAAETKTAFETKAEAETKAAHDRRRTTPVSREASAGDTTKLVALNTTRATAPDRDGNPELARQAQAILKKYCYRCHGVRFEVPGYNVLDRDVLVAKRGEDEPPYVVPGKPADSFLWERIGVDKDMPPSAPKPAEEERALIGRWIEAGAPFPQADLGARPLKTEKEVLAAIRDHLRAARETDRPFLRYFTLHNLHNSKTVSDEELRLGRAAVAKLVNSLSWKPDIAVPAAIDPERTVLALDVRDVGWDERDLWKEIVSRYPYGLTHDKDREEAVRRLAAEVYTLSGTSLPFVRADWFVATVSRPPLYDTILDMPRDAQALERLLKVDVENDFLKDKLARAGFATSGVSSQNRLVDRHPALYGAYWKSYDFKQNEGPGNLFRFPLGPVFADNPYPRQAFEHAGGELIFNLPNGLQGYLLVDARGQRIEAGPIEVVSDALRTSGTAAIVAGLSCMACHQHGTILFKDTVRAGLAVEGNARAKADQLFLTKEAMDRLLKRDEARFLKALDEATGGFLKVGEDQSKAIRDFPEPIGAVARAYLKDLGPEEVAAELGLGDPKDLVVLIKANARLGQLGLAPLIQGATIKRTEWDSLVKRSRSTFQQAAQELLLGTPIRGL
jgi:serine/threonine-protein kinase